MMICNKCSKELSEIDKLSMICNSCAARILAYSATNDELKALEGIDYKSTEFSVHMLILIKKYMKHLTTRAN